MLKNYDISFPDHFQVSNTLTGQTAEGVAVAKQYFKTIPRDRADALVQKGTIMYCAGGFAIEEMEDLLLKREGERETVMGLPAELTRKLLSEVGYQFAS